MRIPTQQEILKDFITWTERGSDSAVQFERAVRRWISCGYSTAELPLVFDASPAQVHAAIQAAIST